MEENKKKDFKTPLINPEGDEEEALLGESRQLDESCSDFGQKSYWEYKQRPGNGKKRIGQILELEEGIYSLLFVANFSRVFLVQALAKADEDKSDDEKEKVETGFIVGETETDHEKVCRRKKVKNESHFLGISKVETV